MAQVRPPPPELKFRERFTVERIVKVPHNSLPTPVLHALSEVGLPAPPPATAICAATLPCIACAAHARLAATDRLEQAREMYLPLAAYADRFPATPGWDSMAIVDEWSLAISDVFRKCTTFWRTSTQAAAVASKAASQIRQPGCSS